MKKTLMTSILVLGLGLITQSEGYAAGDAPVDVRSLQKDLSIYVDFLNQKTKEYTSQIDKANEARGHNKQAYEIILQAQLNLEKLQNATKKLKDAVRSVQPLLATTANTQNAINFQLKSVDQMIVTEAEDFPEKCKTLAVGGDIEMHKGIVEKFVNNWVVSFADEKQPDGLRRIHIDDNVGTKGRAADYAVGRTPAGFYVEALIDKTGNNGRGIVRCISPPMKVTQ